MQEMSQDPTSSARISGWNGFDLSTKSGLHRAREERKRLRPKHLWFALPCGPWSGNQNFDVNKPDVWEKVLRSRELSKRTIRNALILAQDQIEDGGYVHWEWPKGLSPYRWESVQSFFKKSNMNIYRIHRIRNLDSEILRFHVVFPSLCYVFP